MKNNAIKFLAVALSSMLIILSNAYADVQFPAISHHYMITMIIGGFPSIFVAISIVLIESIFIKKLMSVNWLKAVFWSFIVNLISSVVGAIIISIPSENMPWWYFLNYPKDRRLGIYTGLLPGYFLTVLIEAITLIVILKKKKKTAATISVFKASAVMNMCSYLIIFIAILMADILTHGECFKIPL